MAGKKKKRSSEGRNDSQRGQEDPPLTLLEKWLTKSIPRATRQSVTVSEPSSYNFEDPQASSGGDNQILDCKTGSGAKSVAKTELSSLDEEYEGAEWDHGSCVSSSQDSDGGSGTEDYLLEEMDSDSSEGPLFDVSSESLTQAADTQDNQGDGMKIEHDHHMNILSVLLRKLAQLSKRSGSAAFPYAKLIEKFGIKYIEERLIKNVNENLKILLESKDPDNESIKQCRDSTIQSCFESGVYIHVMFDTEDDKYIGIYIGSSKEIAPRLLRHIADRKKAEEYKRTQKKIPRMNRHCRT